MKQLIKAEPALDNSQENGNQQQTSVAEVLMEEQDHARVLNEELLQAKVQLAELKADVTTKDSVIHAMLCCNPKSCRSPNSRRKSGGCN